MLTSDVKRLDKAEVRYVWIVWGIRLFENKTSYEIKYFYTLQKKQKLDMEAIKKNNTKRNMLIIQTI